MLLKYRCLLMSTHVTCLEILCIYYHKDFVFTVLFVCSILYYTVFVCSIFVYFVTFTLCFFKKIPSSSNKVSCHLTGWLPFTIHPPES